MRCTRERTKSSALLPLPRTRDMRSLRWVGDRVSICSQLRRRPLVAVAAGIESMTADGVFQTTALAAQRFALNVLRGGAHGYDKTDHARRWSHDESDRSG